MSERLAPKRDAHNAIEGSARLCRAMTALLDRRGVLTAIGLALGAARRRAEFRAPAFIRSLTPNPRPPTARSSTMGTRFLRSTYQRSTPLCFAS